VYASVTTKNNSERLQLTHTTVSSLNVKLD